MNALPLATHPIDECSRALLGVEHSARGLRWIDRLTSEDVGTAQAIVQRHDVPQLLARVLAARGATLDAVPDFLNPTVKKLMPDPSLARDMDAGAARLAAAIKSGEKIAVFGDYDVDGAASSALLLRFLRAHGTDARLYIPDRITEGYGPNADAFALLAEEGTRLIVAADCGTHAHEPIALARDAGVDVVVVDHHLAGERLPPATALVNPNRLDDVSGLGSLAAAGVTFLLLVAVARQLRAEGWYAGGRDECDLLGMLDLVALATICDVVPLQGLNRAFVAKGLQVLRSRRNVGLRALADVANLAAEPDAYHLGFVLGPRINAGGRIGDATLGTRLLVTEDPQEAAKIAVTLDRLNGERQELEKTINEDALSQAERQLEADPQRRVLLVGGEGWHKGVVGLAAARLTERFRRPAIAIAWHPDGRGTGSARSVPGLDIGGAVRAACERGLLMQGGGHEMAAGLTVERARLEAFGEMLEHALDGGEGRQLAELRIDGALVASGATEELIKMIDQAGPFGAGNPRPRFAFAAHRCGFSKVVGDAHVRCSLVAGDGSRIQAVAFRCADTPLGALLRQADGMPLHVAGHLKRNSWGGKVSVELVIEDAARPAHRG